MSKVHASTYYVDNCDITGNDTNNGTSISTPWLTINKVNTSSFVAGDTISFRKGCTWREQLTIPSSGTADNVIIFGSYGATGEKPIINGSNIFSTWVDNSSSGSYDFGPDGFETGDISLWDTKTDTASKLSVVNGSLIDGTYSIKIINDVTTPAYLSKAFTQFDASTWTASFKVKFDSNFTVGASSGTQMQLAEIENTSWGMIFEVYAVNTTGSTMAWKIVRNRPSYTAVTTSSNIVPGNTYTVTMSSTGIGGGISAGTFDLSINGVSVYNATGLNLSQTDGKHYPNKFSIGRFTSNAATPAGILYFDTAYIDRDNALTPSVSNSWYASMATEPKVVYFNNTLGTNVASISACDADKKWYWTGGKLYTYGTVNPNTTYPSQIEAGQRNYAVQFNASGNSHLIFQNLDFANTNSTGLNISAYSSAVSDVTVDGITARGIYGYGVYIDTDGNGHNLDSVTVQNSILHHNGLAGVTVGTPDTTTISNVTIQKNTVYSNTWRWDNLDKGGIHAFGPTITNLIIQDNDVYDNGDALPNFKSTTLGKRTGHGIYPDSVGSGLIVRRNKSHNNNSGGISVEYTDAASVYDNVSYSNGKTGLSIYRLSHNNVMYNNTSYGNDVGLAVWAGSGAVGGLTGNLIKNNISTGNLTRQLYATYGGENDGTNGSGNVYLYNNFGPETSNFIEWGSGVYKSTYATLDTAYGATTHSVVGDPFFTNAGSNDFSLLSTSPAIDTGTSLGDTYKLGLNPNSVWPNVVNTLDQTLNGLGWDIGAYIYTQSTSPTVSLSAPPAGAVSRTITVTANPSASSPASISSVQFTLDGSNLDPAVTVAPYSISWNSASVSDGSHALSAVATDTYGNTATASNISITVSNSTISTTASASNGAPVGLIGQRTQNISNVTLTTTTASLQNQLTQLTAQLQLLIAQKNTLYSRNGSTTSPLATYTFTRDLSLNSKSTDVLYLQKLLNSLGFTISPSAAGSPGNETTLFGTLTYKALQRFQKSVGLPATGFFGPATRGYVNGR